MYYIKLQNSDIKIKVSQATYYKILKKEYGLIFPERTYEISINSLKKYPRLYNRARSNDWNNPIS